jgi:putative transposase
MTKINTSQPITLSHRIRLYPTDSQLIQLNKAVGTARFTYNYILEKYDQLRAEGVVHPKVNDIQIEFNRIKAEQFPWMYESPKNANQRPFTNFDRALTNFFAGRAGYPTYKKRGRHDSFYLSNDRLKLTDTSIHVAHIGSLKLAEPLRFTGKVMSATISRTADH